MRRFLDLLFRLARDARERLYTRDVTVSTPTLLRGLGGRALGDPVDVPEYSPCPHCRTVVRGAHTCPLPRKPLRLAASGR